MQGFIGAATDTVGTTDGAVGEMLLATGSVTVPDDPVLITGSAASVVDERVGAGAAEGITAGVGAGAAVGVTVEAAAALGVARPAKMS